MGKTVNKRPARLPEPAMDEATAIAQTDAAPLDVEAKFARLAEIAQVCTMCDLSQNRMVHAVFGSGNIRARAMLIGEGPGKTEDKVGLPFVGSAGRHLDRVLENVGLDRQRDLYITNMVKCHHRGQRPTAGEMKACSPYLETQIRHIRPKILILTGASAMKGLLGTTGKITDIHGTWLETPFEGTRAMAVFHPSFLIYTESLSGDNPLWQAWEADWRRIKEALDGL